MPHLEEAGAHHHVLVAAVGQQWGGRAWREGAKLHYVNVVITRHRVGGTPTGVVPCAKCPGDAHLGTLSLEGII